MIRRALAIGSLLLPLMSFATPQETTPVEMTRGDWLTQVNTGIPEPVCKSFIEDPSIAAQMKVRNISYQSCVSLMPKIAENCEKKYATSIPATLDDQSAHKWGKVIGECIGNDFAMLYLSAETTADAAQVKSTN